jgi:hypothetical protein
MVENSRLIDTSVKYRTSCDLEAGRKRNAELARRSLWLHCERRPLAKDRA